ncbi:MAG: hypothetical protein HKN64_06225 [Woeseiaceae bacterium]|nr:hypothetical protein [Woeseiaceae bacterium]
MSNQDKDQELEHSTEQSPPDADDSPPNSAADAVEATEATAEADATTDDAALDNEPPPPAKPVKQRGNGVAWLALLASLIALAAVGYSVSRDWLAAKDTGTADTLARLDGRVATLQQGLSEIDGRVTRLDVPNSDAAGAIDAIRQELAAGLAGVEALPARMSSLEAAVGALSGVSEASRETWLLAEAEYYLQIANAQLQLANNPELAALALRMADERVVQISDPALTNVRQAIADDRAALDLLDKPDIAGATLTLASLARVVESLPLAAAASRPGTVTQPVDAEQGGMARAWRSVKDAMSGLVKVTPPDQEKLSLLTPDAEYFLRNNLALQLQSARLALLRGEQAVFEQTLDDAAALISQYFDNGSASVEGALATLGEIRSTVLATALPDISGSLRQLRQFRALRENSQ